MNLNFLSKSKSKLTKNQINHINEFNNMIRNGKLSLYDSRCLCGSLKNLKITDVDRYEIEVASGICKECGMSRTLSFLNPSSVEVFYSKYYRSMYVGSEVPPEEFFEDQYYRGKKLFRFLRETKYFKNEKLKILEIGSGAGGVLLAFKEQGHDVMGYDFDLKYLDLGKSKGINLIHHDSFIPDEYMGCFDLIILSHVLEHFNEPRKNLLEYKSFLKSDGAVLCEVPGWYSIHKNYFNPIDYFQNAHTYNYSKKNLDELFQEVGFGVALSNEDVVGLYVNNGYYLKSVETHWFEYYKSVIYIFVVQLAWVFKFNPYYYKLLISKKIRSIFS